MLTFSNPLTPEDSDEIIWATLPAGTDVSSSVANGTTTPVITLNIPTASAANRGVLSAADWTTFNNKGSGSVTSASVVTANGFASTVATASTTPAITLTTTVTGLVKGNGTSLSAATAGTDYLALVVYLRLQ